MFAIPKHCAVNHVECSWAALSLRLITVFLPVFSLSLSKKAAINALLLAYNLSFSSLIADSSTMPTLQTKL